MQPKLSKYLEDHASEMIAVLSKLVAIPSVKGEPEEGMPYGKENARVLDTMLTMAENYGFTVTNHENYVGTIDFDAAKETTLGVLCHLDVVPEGTGWTNPPYTLTLKGGKLYGRGSADDKGPAVAVLFAMRALRECGYKLTRNVRMIVGCDEECGSSDIAYYRKKEKLPPYVFTPDASYPVINLEKGHIFADVAADKTYVGGEKTIHSAKGGIATNAVPEKAYATLRGFSKAEIMEAAKMLPAGVTVNVVEKGDISELTVNGVAAHASNPYGGKNAVTALFRLLGALDTADERAKFFKNLTNVLVYGEGDGSSLGLKVSDEKSGALTFVFSVFNFENGKFTGKYDIRFPICENCASVRTKCEKALATVGLSITEFKGKEPHYVDENSDFVQALLSVYTEMTHKPGYCIAIGGGTYVHEIPGGVAFGAEFQGEDAHIHGADEFISLENLITNAKIFAEAILRICK